MRKYLPKKWPNQWKHISPANKPIEDWLNTQNGDGKSLIDIGCGAGYLSEIAIERGFKVTSVDLGNTPYIHNIKEDVMTMTGSYDYLVASGFPPINMPTKLKVKNFIYTTSRDDFKEHYTGNLYYTRGIWIRTNLNPLEHWQYDKKSTII